MDHSDSTSVNIFDREHSLHGGAIKCAAIRFPPKLWFATDRFSRQWTQQCYQDLRSHGRIVFSRGPWIESYPLFTQVANDVDPIMGINKSDNCCKVLAFAQTVENVHGMIFPSSSSSLSYARSSSFNTVDINNRSHSDRNASSLISVVAYGGRRLSFFSGGSLWTDSCKNQVRPNDNVHSESNTSSDPFVPIPITWRSSVTISNTKNETSSYDLQVSDWIHDVSWLDLPWDFSKSSKDEHHCPQQQRENMSFHSFLLALAMVNNNCEIWGFRASRFIDTQYQQFQRIDDFKHMTLSPTRLQCITCDVRCMTYSFSFCGWNEDGMTSPSTNCLIIGKTSNQTSMNLPTLLAASGTVFGEILVWGVVRSDRNIDTQQWNESYDISTIVKNWQSKENNSVIKTLRSKVSPTYRLQGHLGSVFSVKFGHSGEIATVSDDRSVRLWTLQPLNRSLSKATGVDKYEKQVYNRDASKILELSSTHHYTLAWTGWGHTARVWDVTFATIPDSASCRGSIHHLPYLVSAGEDSVARIWNPFFSEKEVGHPLRGHRCESLWIVNASEGIIITGGNDGCVKLWNLESRIRQAYTADAKDFSLDRDNDVTVVTVPMDASTLEASEKFSLIGANSCAEKNEALKSRKKQLKKAKCKRQIICGMEFYTNIHCGVQSKLLVSTRAGSLLSFDLKNNAWETHKSWSDDVVSTISNDVISIDPSTGVCLSVHPGGEKVVTGTTEGWLILSNLKQLSSATDQNKFVSCSQNIAFRAQPKCNLQLVSWVDNDNLLVFYARGTIIWWSFEYDKPTKLHIMLLGNNAIPISYAYDENECVIYIGDTRGNLAYFALSTSRQTKDGEPLEKIADGLLHRVHAKEHVTGLKVLSSMKTIFSVGNDGYMHQCRKDTSGNLLKILSIPVANVTGLRNIWTLCGSGEVDSIFVGGYYGNDFVMTEILNGYEYIRVPTGGRQRRHEFFFNFASKSLNVLQVPNMHGIAVCSGLYNGCNQIIFHTSQSFRETTPSSEASHNGSSLVCNVGLSLHGETINDMCWIEFNGFAFLLSGSNDCTVKLSKFEMNKFVSVKELPPHESCVRGVCSSHHPQSNVTLLVTCGGKLSMEFYLLEHNSFLEENSHSTSSLVSFLSSYRTLGIKSIDHRMNAVRAVPILSEEQPCHFVVSGDSDGNLHVVVVPEKNLDRKTIIGKIVHGNGRPILSLALLQCLDHVLVFVGNTAGEICAWNLPVCCHTESTEEGSEKFRLLPGTPFLVFKPHQSGVNDIGVILVSQDNSSNMLKIAVCSVGDDQALSLCLMMLRIDVSTNQGSFKLMEKHLVTKNASTSSLMALKIVTDDTTFHRVYVTGHDGFITLYELKYEPLSLNYLASSNVGTEGNTIDCLLAPATPNGQRREIIAVGGEGVELQLIDISIIRAAIRLKAANYLLITAGAGFSADSGLPTYEHAPSEYRELCDPTKIIDETYRFQQFWLKFTKSYSVSSPHQGYELIDEWLRCSILPNLKKLFDKRSSPMRDTVSPLWIYTSNVDGHFRRFTNFENVVCEIHGVANDYICSCSIGYSNGSQRCGKLWNQWNQGVISMPQCKDVKLNMVDDILEDFLGKNEILLCQFCHLPMRPNVLMFHDTDENVLKYIAIQRERYQYWESKVEEAISHQQKKLVILELGCGVNVPAVRQESEQVLVDCSKMIKSKQPDLTGSVCLIRVNTKNAEICFDEHLQTETEAISIHSTAATALKKIDYWLKKSVSEFNT